MKRIALLEQLSLAKYSRPRLCEQRAELSSKNVEMDISTHRSKVISVRTVPLPKRAWFGGNTQGTFHA